MYKTKGMSVDEKARIVHYYITDPYAIQNVGGTRIGPYLRDEEILQLTAVNYGYESVDDVKRRIQEKRARNVLNGRYKFNLGPESSGGSSKGKWITRQGLTTG